MEGFVGMVFGLGMAVFLMSALVIDKFRNGEGFGASSFIYVVLGLVALLLILAFFFVAFLQFSHAF